MTQLANFVGAAQAGTESGKSTENHPMGSVNPLTGFVKNMLASYKEKQETQSKAGLEGLKSMFSTQEALSSEGREQGYKLEAEGREQGYKLAEEGREQGYKKAEEERKLNTPGYVADTEATNMLAKVRAAELGGELTPFKASALISTMDTARIRGMQRSAPEVWEYINNMALKNVPKAMAPAAVAPTTKKDKSYLMQKYNLKPK